jgi:hypothetical protein
VHLLFVAPAFVAFMAYVALETRRGALALPTVARLPDP